jgi:hypothetical protein
MGGRPGPSRKSGRVARLNVESGAGLTEAHGEPWPTLAACSAPTAKSKSVSSSPAGRLPSAIKSARTAVEVIGVENPERCGADRDVDLRAMTTTHEP